MNSTKLGFTGASNKFCCESLCRFDVVFERLNGNVKWVPANKMQEVLTIPVVQTFLSQYPQSCWTQCIKAAVVYGIQCLNRKYEFQLTVPQLSVLAGFPDTIKTEKLTRPPKVPVFYAKSPSLLPAKTPVQRQRPNSASKRTPMKALPTKDKSFTGGQEQSLMKLADQFLKSPLAAHLSKERASEESSGSTQFSSNPSIQCIQPRKVT